MQITGDPDAFKALAEFKAYVAGPLLVLDLAGTFVFAVSGAVAGIRVRLDIFGVLVLSFAAASAGGVIRDVLIGSIPPAAISDWRYPVVSLASGLFAFLFYPLSKRFRRLHNHVLIFDAAGLALFAVVGTQKAIGYGLNPIMAALLGMLTGIGGGMLRDVLIRLVPTVLRSELYAVAALAGATVVVTGHLLNLSPAFTAICGAILCFGMRVAAIWRGWHLPVALFERKKRVDDSNESDAAVD